MAEQNTKRQYSIEEYFEFEANDPSARYEYVDGFIYDMAGGSIRHGTLISNALYRIREGLQEDKQSCRGFSGDVKVAVEQAKAYLYPDVFVVCGEIDDQMHPNQAIRNPRLVIEVLSKSTQSFDQTQKFRLYRTNPDFAKYVMVDQEQAIVESYFRIEEDHWQISTYIGLDKEVELKSLDLKIRMRDLYENVFP
jgi:Uma2 family endonuclease